MDIIDALSPLLSIATDAAFAVRGGRIVMTNAAAEREWKAIVGRNVADVLPPELLDDKLEGPFVGGAVMKTLKRKRKVVVSSSVYEDTRLYFVKPEKPFPEYKDDDFLLASIRREMAELKVYIDVRRQRAMDNPDYDRREDQIFELYYYRLLRMLENYTTIRTIQNEEKIERKVVDISRLLQDICNSTDCVSRFYGRRVYFRHPGRPILALVNQQMMEQVILNLLTNSLQHMEHGNSVDVNIAADDMYMTIAVEDDGSGVPRESLSNLFTGFDKYNNDAVPGAALGLRVANLVARAHGGTTLFDSREGGTSVRVRMARFVEPLSGPEALWDHYEVSPMETLIVQLSAFLDSPDMLISYFE